MSKWRAGLLALVAFGFFSLGVAIWSEFTIGVAGVNADTTATPFVSRVSAIRPESISGRAGLRVGDLVDLRKLSPADRFAWQYAWRAGERITLHVTRGDATRTIAFTPSRRPVPWSIWLVIACEVWMLLFSALIAWRAADNAHARVLALFLASFPIAIDWYPANFITPWPALDLLLGLTLYAIIFPASQVMLAAYAALFARPLTRLRRGLTYASYAIAAATAAFYMANLLGVWTAQFDLTAPPFSDELFILARYVGLVLFPLLCAFAAIRATAGAERARLLWATLTIGSIYCGGLVIPTVGLIAPGLLLPPADKVILSIANSSLVLAPLGMCYAVFNRRLVDFGFVLNRAAIFSGVSIVIVGLFVLTEWALSEWMRTASHETNIAVSAALALLLGLSIRFVHTKVEHVVDHVMFRKRREDEEAIRKMAREAPYITDRATLLERVRQTLERHAGASFVNVLLDDGRGRFDNVNENDAALVTLRAEHARLDLHETQTAIEGEWAWPMVARGRLVGALVLGPKQSQESYAPDESAAIAQLAHSVAGALDVLATQAPAETLESIRASLDTVADAIAAQSDLLRTLAPQAGVQR